MEKQNQSADMAAASDQMSSPERGHLKIFFSYAAGVGKTYAMLDAAHMEKKHGTDVAVGYIKSNAHPQTRARLNGSGNCFRLSIPNIMELLWKSLTLIKP